nr:MAG TPA: Minor Head Virion Protein G6P [Inoviridae sp.]
MSIWSNVVNVSNVILQSGIKRLLMGAGLGLTSGAVVLVVFNYYLTKFINAFDMIDSDYIGLLGLMGVDKAVSMIVGAYVIRLTILSTRLSIRAKSHE